MFCAPKVFVLHIRISLGGKTVKSLRGKTTPLFHVLRVLNVIAAQNMIR